MTAQMRNAGQLNAAIHESAGSRHGRRQLATGRQVKGEVTLGKLRRTGHGQTALSVANLRTQRGQKLTPHIAHLGRTRRRISRGCWPVRNSHRLAGNHGGGKERTGIRQVRFNGHLKAGERTGVNRPTVLAALCFVALVRVVLLHLNTHLAQRLHGHLNVRDGRHRRALVHQHHALRQARRHQQQRRNELGRRRSINTNHGRLRNTLYARQTGGAQHEGQSVLALLTIHMHTQLTQTLQNRTHRTLTSMRVTVKSELTRQ